MAKTSGSFGFLRIATATPALRVADVAHNLQTHREILESAQLKGAALVVFPELSLTGYTCGDLFAQSALVKAAGDALLALASSPPHDAPTAVVGLPVAWEGRLYNCAAWLSAGRVQGIVPKQFLPTGGEFYEERWFTRGSHITACSIEIAGETVPFGVDLLFRDARHNLLAGTEICEDLWAVSPPSGDLCAAGANLICNPSASNELLGKSSYRRDLVKQQSARALTAYAYASAGPGESSTDVVYSGHNLIAENGGILVESQRFCFESTLQTADIDLERLDHDRRINSSFSAITPCRTYRRVDISLPSADSMAADLGAQRPHPRQPFVPAASEARAATCAEIFAIQSAGLCKRLRHIGATKVVLGISGGLDSTLALLVTAHAFDLLGLDRKGIIAPTMPGFGTTHRTRNNAAELAGTLGVSLRTISISPSVKQHFADIGHDPAQHDITYENSQARERTQILMDLANQVGGLVIGTGDLSEAALGWCTFNGDHMSMYHVNIGVPKTLVKYLIEWCAETEFSGATAQTLRDIIATPISPELLPADSSGNIQQKTESVVGPYELHDFFLYYVVRHGFAPSKVVRLATLAFGAEYPRRTIIAWLDVFLRRFFAQQFKRSSMPDGPKVGTVALSPRGDWRMPSDACVDLWLSELSILESST